MKRYESYKPSGISWIGEIPSHWEVRRNKYLFKEEDEKNLDLSFQLLTFSRKKGIIPFSEVNEKEPSASDLNSYKVIRQGQLLENRMQAWSGMFAKSEIDGCVSPDYSVFSPTSEDVCVDFFAHLFRTNQYIAHWANLSRGVGNGFNRLYTNQFHSVYALFPPLEEQKKIVEYLSTKTSLIDAQQSAREREIRLLEELKQAEIANVVTRGLNPDVPMKDSGIPWIGKIPSHWEIRKIRSLYALRTEKVSDKDFEPLSVSKQGVTPQLEDAVKTDNGDNRKLVRKGDFVVNSRSDRKGSCGVSDLDGSVSLINIVIYPITKLNPQYYHQLFRSNNYIEEFYRLGRGIVADLWTTKFDDMRNIFVPYPPIEEQRAIVEYIEQKNKAIDDMIANLRAEIDFLTEYKQRLIADAVTGQIKID